MNGGEGQEEKEKKKKRKTNHGGGSKATKSPGGLWGWGGVKPMGRA